MDAGRTPQGVRGLKPDSNPVAAVFDSRTPQGVRGLKLYICSLYYFFLLSHSARSAWIETGVNTFLAFIFLVALRKECVD